MLSKFNENIALDRRPSFGVEKDSAIKCSKTFFFKPEADGIANLCFSDSNGRSDWIVYENVMLYFLLIQL